VKYTIDMLVKEATKIKAFNVSHFTFRLPEKVRETLRHESHRNRVDKNILSKTKLREVRTFMSK
jgi:hypothetical protein